MDNTTKATDRKDRLCQHNRAIRISRSRRGRIILPFIIVLSLLAPTTGLNAQEPSPIDVQVLPSLDGEKEVQISIKPQETPVTLELPELRPISIAPTPTPVRPRPTATQPAPVNLAPSPTANPTPVPAAAVAPPQSTASGDSSSTLLSLPAGVLEERDRIHEGDTGLNLAEPIRDEPEASAVASPTPAPALNDLPLLEITDSAATDTLALPDMAHQQPAESTAEDMLRRRFEAIQAKAQQGQIEQARSEFQKLAGDFPASAIAPEALYTAAQLEKSSAQSRIAEFLAITARYPNTPWAARSYHAIGVVEMEIGNHPAALEAFRTYQSSGDEAANNAELETNIIDCLFQLRRHEEALTELAKLETDLPDAARNEKLADTKAECLMALKRYDEAISALKAFTQDYPNSPLVPKALLCQGLCFEQIGRTDDARGIYDLLLRKYPSDAGGNPPSEVKLARERMDQIDKSLLP